ncbi:hypothetical protein [Nocardia aurantia]|uniref:Uncharacterized protein n=1 Tax=Nocardia aurantia TaxID=2585199 RepID=A0A7K0E1P6_9NOCA|nr:hypothetical protein [Nocardia aurantia]MQY31697.1 hypothetical protein [Nocardia aurantia]
MTQPPRIEDVTGYLRTHGWIVSGRWRGAEVWSRDEYDVLLPPSDTVADARSRLRELIRCVASAEERSAADVRHDMLTPAVDIVSYRTDGDTALTLTAGAGALSGVRDLFAACARESLDENSSGQPGRPPEAVRSLLERSLLAVSTETFGIDVRVPIDGGEPEPLGRRTTLRLLRSSARLLSAVESETDAVERVSRHDVSEAICGALAELAGGGHTAPFELGFRWSQLIPRDNTALRFPAGAGERIRAVSRRTAQVVDTATVEGLVTELSDDEEGDRWRVKVRGTLTTGDAEPAPPRQLVAVRLADATQYAAALAAHRDGRLVRATGSLARTRRTREITTAETGFITIDRTHP